MTEDIIPRLKGLPETDLSGVRERLEAWRPVAGREGLYEVSDLGRVRGPKGIMAGAIDHTRGGYRKITLKGYRPFRAVYVHWLVAAAFLGPRPDGLEVAHLNGDPLDNRLSNLAYVTPKINGEQRVAHGTQARGERQGHAKLTADLVMAIRAQKESSATIAARYGLHPASVRRLRNGGSWAWLK